MASSADDASDLPRAFPRSPSEPFDSRSSYGYIVSCVFNYSVRNRREQKATLVTELRVDAVARLVIAEKLIEFTIVWQH